MCAELEAAGKGKKTLKARRLWSRIREAQMDTATHCWPNAFAHLLAAILSDCLALLTFEEVFNRLTRVAKGQVIDDMLGVRCLCQPALRHLHNSTRAGLARYANQEVHLWARKTLDWRGVRDE